jgi:hypothetical protein
VSNQRFASVWDAIEDTPEEAENMKLRSMLMMELKNHIARAGMSQALWRDAAARLRSDARQDQSVRSRRAGEYGDGRRITH